MSQFDQTSVNFNTQIDFNAEKFTIFYSNPRINIILFVRRTYPSILTRELISKEKTKIKCGDCQK